MIGQVEYVEETCLTCHIPFAITRELYNTLRNCHNTFYCPKGHGQNYIGESDVEREKRLRLITQKERDSLIAQCENLEGELAKLKARRKTTAKPKPKKATK